MPPVGCATNQKLSSFDVDESKNIHKITSDASSTLSSTELCLQNVKN